MNLLKKMYPLICDLLFFTSIFFSSIAFAADLYESFQNPPVSVRPVVRWEWPAKSPNDNEITKQLETFKNSGFGGVEIAPAQINLVTAKSLKFTAVEAKKLSLSVDLVISRPSALTSFKLDESASSISLDKKYFNNLSAVLAPSFGGNLGDSLHAISFIKSDLFNERFLVVFNDFCRGNAVLARFEFPANSLLPGFSDVNLPFDIPQIKMASSRQVFVSSTGHFVDKPLICCRLADDPCLLENQAEFFEIYDLAFASGINQLLCTEQNAGSRSRIDRNARLSAVFRNSRLNLNPNVEISPANSNLSFINYVAGDRDIFFFTNADNASSLSFYARFDTGEKTPWLWDPETGNRNLFHSGSSKNSLDIELDPLDSILIVFEPNLPDNSPSLNKN